MAPRKERVQRTAAVRGDRPDSPAALRSPGLSFSTRQVAQLLAVGEATVKRLTDSGALPCLRGLNGGSRRFAPEDLIAHLRQDHPAPAPVRPSLLHLAGAGEITQAVAVALELLAQGFTVERFFDAFLAPVIQQAAPGFVEALADRLAALGAPRVGRVQPVAVIIPVGRSADPWVSLVSAVFRAHAFEVLRPVDPANPRLAAQVALRANARAVAFVFSGELFADAVAEEALALAGQMAVAFAPGSVCAVGPRLRSLPEGVVPLQSMEDLRGMIDAG